MNEKVKITLIYDNETIREDLTGDWGFACLVKAQGQRILFDTGADGEILLANMEALDIQPGSIGTVVISHHHWDHTGGLLSFLDRNPDVRLYIPATYDPPAIARESAVRVTEPVQIDENIYSTGLLEGIEQSLVIKTGPGNIIIVGCSHSGVGNILKAASEYGQNYALLGGLHGFDDYDILSELKHICPTHCTQHKAEIAQKYPGKLIEGGAGKIIEL